jgi:hypothetical protein
VHAHVQADQSATLSIVVRVSFNSARNPNHGLISSITSHPALNLAATSLVEGHACSATCGLGSQLNDPSLHILSIRQIRLLCGAHSLIIQGGNDFGYDLFPVSKALLGMIALFLHNSVAS